MILKKGDNVKMLTGKDRGKNGKILFVLENRVVVEGLNTIKKHQKAKKQGQKGQIVSKERAVHVSSVQMICPKCGKATKLARKILGDHKLRICKKCQAEI